MNFKNAKFFYFVQLGFAPDENVRGHIERFIVEYLTLYDGPNGESTRKALMNAYDDCVRF